MSPRQRPGWKVPTTAAEFTRVLTQSRLNGWLNGCRQQQHFIYVLGWREPPAAAASWGTAWDRTLTAQPGQLRPYADIPTESREGYLAMKMREGKNPPMGVAQDLFREIWKEEAASVERWGEETPETLERAGIASAKVWVRDRADLVEPVALQQEFQLGLLTGDERWAISGVTDLVVRDGAEGRPFLCDIKTASRRWADGDAAVRLQHAHYSIGVENDSERFPGVDPNRFRYEVMVRTKDPVVQVFDVEISPELRREYLVLLGGAKREMGLCFEAKVFLPNREWHRCSRRHCGFWAECEARWPGLPAVKE